VQTLKQLLPLPGGRRVLPTGAVRDWPAMKYRGIDDDLSRGPFPTLEFQKHQIRVFAAFKINIYSPYIEHTLLYPDQPLAAPPASSLTPAEVKELVAFARQYHVTIVPEQEAFGHLHQVLKYDLYQDVAETPHGHVLAPGQPGTLPLIKDWFTQAAAEFPSPFLHIGADETFDLGVGRTRPQVLAKGYGPVYVEFLKQIHEELAPLHRRLVIYLDADLYSSTLYVLTSFAPHLKAGDLLVLDDFASVRSPTCVFRALMDFRAAYGVRYTPLASSSPHALVALRVDAVAGWGKGPFTAP
jgi:hypothetical protein